MRDYLSPKSFLETFTGDFGIRASDNCSYTLVALASSVAGILPSGAGLPYVVPTAVQGYFFYTANHTHFDWPHLPMHCNKVHAHLVSCPAPTFTWRVLKVCQVNNHVFLGSVES